MKTKARVVLSVLAGAILVSGSASAQQAAQTAKQRLIGTWTLVSITLERGGKKTDFYGPNPHGTFIADGKGHFARIITRSDLPKIASNNRVAGTPEENKAIVQGSIALFGTYSVNEAEKTLAFHIEGSTFPNWVGIDQKRSFTFVGDELRDTNPSPSVGEGTSLLVWKRAQ